MSEPQCQGCRELLQRVAEMEAVVRDLQARLGLNSRNSSLPPSANPLGAPPHPKKNKSKRRRGA
jgi:transposase